MYEPDSKPINPTRCYGGQTDIEPARPPPTRCVPRCASTPTRTPARTPTPTRTRYPHPYPFPLPVPLSPARTPIPYPTLTPPSTRDEALFEAFAGIARIYAACGPTMMIVAKNDQASGRARARFRLGPNPNPQPHSPAP